MIKPNKKLPIFIVNIAKILHNVKENFFQIQYFLKEYFQL